MDFYDSWMFLNEHKMFNRMFEEGLYTCVVKVNPQTNAVDDDRKKNTKVQIWIEHGPWEKHDDGFPEHCHDFDLDCGGDTFEEAIIKLANLVKKHYTDDGKKRSLTMTEKEKLMDYIKEPITTDARNRMGCSENWYNPYYAIKQTFSTEEMQNMTDKEVDNLVRLADEIGMNLY